MEERFQGQNREVGSLSIKDIFYKYLRFLPLIILSIALSLLVAYVYLRYATPYYSATGSLILKDDQPLRGSNQKFEQVLTDENSKNVQNEIEVLKSRPLMERVVRSLNLNFTYYAKGKIKDLNVYKICPFKIIASNITDSSNSFSLQINFINQNTFTINNEKTVFSFGQTFKNQFGQFTLIRINENQVADIYNLTWFPTFILASNLSKELLVAPKNQGTGILLLSLETDSPDLTSDVINKTMDEYQNQTLEDKNQTNEKSISFIDGRLKVVQKELDSLNKQRLAFMSQSNIIDAEAQTTNFLTNISETNKALNTQETQLDIVIIIENYLADKNNAYDPVPSTLGISDPTLTTLIAGYNAAQLERKALIDGNVPVGNLLVKQVEQRIEKIRKDILENLKNIKSSFKTSLQNLQAQNSRAENQAKSIPTKQQVLEDIKRQLERKVAVYDFLSEQKEEYSIALASNITGSKIIDVAYANNNPIRPNKNNIRLIAIAIGIALPILLIFIIEVLNDKITIRSDIEKLTDVTILGEIGHSFGLKTLMVTSNGRSVIAEQFRIIRSNIQYFITNVERPVILITSSFSGEGKSFISTNVGAVMALAGKKTIVLEFDIRKPKILSQLNISKKPGLINYLLGKIKAEDLPIPVEGSENLFVLACGPVPPNPAELLLEPKLKDLFDYLKRNFDIIIMDTAPVGMVSDAMTLSKFADCTLYIVRQGHTFKKQIGLIDEFHRDGKLPRISIILNDVKVTTGYGYYGYGKYGYGYGSGYFENEEKDESIIDKILNVFSRKRKKKGQAIKG